MSIKGFLKKLYRHSGLTLFFIINPVKLVYDILRLYCVDDSRYIIGKYKKTFNRPPDLKHPRLFTEKLQWMKLYVRNPLYTQAADKYAVRSLVSEKIGEKYLIPLIFYSNDPSELLRCDLPKAFIIKTTHGSTQNILVKDGIMTFSGMKAPLNRRKMAAVIRRWLRLNPFAATREWQYKNVPPAYVVEELMEDEEGRLGLGDYKIHCFAGKPCYIQTIFDRFDGGRKHWYTSDWESVSIGYSNEENIGAPDPAPDNLKEILSIAGKLSEPFPYVRVDLYSVKGRVYFGELTFHPYSGLMQFDPPEWDYKLGELLCLPGKN